MRRKDRQLSEKESRDILLTGEFGVLSLATMGGEPYGVPLSYVVWDEHIYFHSACKGRKIDLLAANPQASFCVVGPTRPVEDDGFTSYYECVMVAGTVSFVSDCDEMRKALLVLTEKYFPGCEKEAHMEVDKYRGATAVYKMTIKSITGKANRP